MSDSRKKIIASFRMPDRLTSAERIATATADVQDATAHLKRTLTDKALTMSATDWAIDDESWEFAINGRLVVGTVVVTR